MYGTVGTASYWYDVIVIVFPSFRNSNIIRICAVAGSPDFNYADRNINSEEPTAQYQVSASNSCYCQMFFSHKSIND